MYLNQNHSWSEHTSWRPELGCSEPGSWKGCIFSWIRFRPCILHQEWLWMWSALNKQFSVRYLEVVRESKKGACEAGNTLRTLLLGSAFPFSIWAISSLMDIRASQNLSNSACKKKTTNILKLPKNKKDKNAERVNLAFTFGGFNHECSWNWPGHRRSMETIIHETFCNIFRLYSCGILP